MHYTQSNTKTGDLVKIAAATIPAAGRLVQLVDASGDAKVQLPSAIGGPVQFVSLEAANAGDPVNVRPIEPGTNIRVTTLTGYAGASAVMTNTDGIAIPAATGSGYTVVYVVGLLEEDSVPGADHLALIRPFPYKIGAW